MKCLTCVLIEVITEGEISEYHHFFVTAKIEKWGVIMPALNICATFRVAKKGVSSLLLVLAFSFFGLNIAFAAEKPPKVMVSPSATQSPVSTHPQNAAKGAICLGPDLSPAPRPKQSVFVQIEGRQSIDFYEKMYKIAYDDLDLNKVYIIKWVYQGKPFVSWKVDFRKLNTNMVMVWKAYGTWKMEAIDDGRCVWPIGKKQGSKRKG